MSICFNCCEITRKNAKVQFRNIGGKFYCFSCDKKLQMNEETAIDNYVSGLKNVLSKTNKNSIIILETGAGVGSEICTKLDKLKMLYDKFTKEEQTRIKFCIDTCHIFASGYNINDINFVDSFIKIIKNTLTWEKIACIHLNDSKDNCGSCKDHHEDITKGNIGTDGLKKFINKCIECNIPIVLETPCDKLSKKDQIALVKSWATKI